MKKKRNQQKVQWFKEKIELEIYDFISKRNNFIDVKNELQKKVENDEISVPAAINHFNTILEKISNNE